MTCRATPLYPASAKEMEALGQRLRDARLRRRFSMETVCARANLSRPTLYKIENGDPSVAVGFYIQVLRVLGLLGDLSLIAKEDALGRRLQDESLPQRRRAPRKKAPAGASDGEKMNQTDQSNHCYAKNMGEDGTLFLVPAASNNLY